MLHKKSWNFYIKPNNWTITRRILTIGVGLGVVALLTPLFVTNRLSTLTHKYIQLTENFGARDKLHDFSEMLLQSEKEINTYHLTKDVILLTVVQKKLEEMESVLSGIWPVVAEYPERSQKLKEVYFAFRGLKSVIEKEHQAALAGKMDPDGGFRDNVTNFILQVRLDARTLEQYHINENVSLNRELANASRSALLTTTFGGIMFFVFFAVLMLSLWHTLIPDISALLYSTRELKKGHLDHRIYLKGQSETAELGRAFNEMAVSLKAKQENLKELNRMKTDFVSTVSHELRTPLTSIKGSIGLILGGVVGKLPDEAEKMLKITQKNTDRLIRLINEVLDISKIEAGAAKMHFDNHSLSETITHAVMGIEAFARTSGVQLVWEKITPSPLVALDHDRIVQVVTNLMSNAIKFTEVGGKVVVSCETANDKVIVHVSDTGKGIPDQALEKIFEKFQQVEAAKNKNIEGTGLGLTIVKSLVEKHGGEVTVNSVMGEGSTFTFTIPWNGAYVEKSPSESSSYSKSILIADNEANYVNYISKVKDYLDNENINVLTANSGSACLRIAEETKPNLIILATSLDEMDGFEVRKQLYDSIKTRDIPIVFVSEFSELKIETYENVVHVLSKPIKEEALKAWLKDFFSTDKAKKAA